MLFSDLLYCYVDSSNIFSEFQDPLKHNVMMGNMFWTFVYAKYY